MSIHHLSKIFTILFKNIFDNQLSINVQANSLKLQKQMIEGLFNSRRIENPDLHRLLIIRILNKIALKLGQIKEQFDEVVGFIKGKYKDLKPPYISKTLNISQLPKRNSFNDEEWDSVRLNFIENSEINIDQYLFTSYSQSLNTTNIFESDEELILNCININQTSYLEYFKDIKDSILPFLIDNTTSIIKNLMQSPIVPTQPQPPLNQQNVPITSNGQAQPYMQTRCRLSSEEIGILGKLLRNGLAIFEYFHNFKFHDKINDEKDSKNNSINAFMSIFSHVSDSGNFKDIIEGNIEVIFKYLLKYAKECFENCLQNFIIHPFFSNPSNPPFKNQSWTNFAEILIKHILKQIVSIPDVLEPCHPYYEYKDDLHYLLQKMVRIPIRSLQKNSDDKFLRPYFKQFVLCLLKKSRKF